MLVRDLFLGNCSSLVEEMKQLSQRHSYMHLRNIGGGLGLNWCVASNIIRFLNRAMQLNMLRRAQLDGWMIE